MVQQAAVSEQLRWVVICEPKVLKSQEYLPWKHEARSSLNITQTQSLGFFVHNGQLSFWMRHVCPPSTLSAEGKKNKDNPVTSFIHLIFAIIVVLLKVLYSFIHRKSKLTIHSVFCHTTYILSDAIENLMCGSKGQTFMHQMKHQMLF